jgi:hypothetical protein
MFTFLPILTLGCISMCFAFMLAIKDILPIISLGLIKHIITIMMTHSWLFMWHGVEVGRGGCNGPNSNVKIGKGVGIFELGPLQPPLPTSNTMPHE